MSRRYERDIRHNSRESRDRERSPYDDRRSYRRNRRSDDYYSNDRYNGRDSRRRYHNEDGNHPSNNSREYESSRGRSRGYYREKDEISSVHEYRRRNDSYNRSVHEKQLTPSKRKRENEKSFSSYSHIYEKAEDIKQPSKKKLKISESDVTANKMAKPRILEPSPEILEMSENSIPLKGIYSKYSSSSSSSEEEEEEEETNKGEKLEVDEDEDDVFDMFSEDDILPSQKTREKKNFEGLKISSSDDENGYYIPRIGELFNDKFKVLDIPIGKGTFSNVLLCEDLEKTKRFGKSEKSNFVAVKVIRNHPTMKLSGLKEIENLNKIYQKSGDGGLYIVKMLEHFYHKKHLCIVFEHLSLNLRQVIDHYGKIGTLRIGLDLSAVQKLGIQLLKSLRCLRESELVHGDFKPDNIMINEVRTVVKLGDFGSAFMPSESVPSPMLQSRFYRAPEIIIGCSDFGYGIDMFSLGCTLYELYTGNLLFPSTDNNDHLKRIIEVKGQIPSKVLKKGMFSSDHFDENFNFLLHSHEVAEESVDLENQIMPPPNINKNEEEEGKLFILKKKKFPVRKEYDLRKLLLEATSSKELKSKENIGIFADCLEKMLALNPSKRLSIEARGKQNALEHQFFKLDL